jgi:histidyl-tRNA synthetase
MIAQRQGELPRILRVAQMFWRYERPQKGRTREFFQWNVDLIGVEGPQADAEVAAVATEFFGLVGLTPEQLRLQVNNRRLVDAQLGRLGLSDTQRGAVYKLIDKREKLPPEIWAAYAVETAGLSPLQFEELQGVLADRELWRQSPDLVAFFELAEAMGTRVAGVRAVGDPQAGLLHRDDLRRATATRSSTRSCGGRYDGLVGDVGGRHCQRSASRWATWCSSWC